MHGLKVAKSTVEKYMSKDGTPRSHTWRTFIQNHLSDIVAIDFLTVPTVTFRILYCFVVVRLDRRRVVHFNVTTNPTAPWTAQQLAWQTVPEVYRAVRPRVSRQCRPRDRRCTEALTV